MDSMNIPGGLPPELAIEQQRIAGRRRMAEALMQRAQQPYQQQTAGGYVTPYSPLQGIAQLLTAYSGRKGLEQSDREMQGLEQKYNEGVAEAVRKYTDAGQPQELPPLTPNDDEGNPMPSATVAPDPRKRVMEALTSPYAPVRELGRMDYQTAQADKKLAAEQTFRAQESQAARDARAAEGQLAREQRRADLEMRAADQRATEADRLAARREIAQMQVDARRDMAAQNAALRRDQMAIADAQRQQKNTPKLPTPALKLQQEELDAIGIGASINADLSGLERQIQEGKLNPSLIGNAIGAARNAVGLSSEESRNLASFKATLEKMRNDSLRLNKGVQTEGDAVRAWNELIANINDKGVVQQRLAEIKKINDRAVTMRKNNIDVIRSNFGLEPLNTAPVTNPPAAVGSSATGAWSVVR